MGKVDNENKHVKLLSDHDYTHEDSKMRTLK